MRHRPWLALALAIGIGVTGCGGTTDPEGQPDQAAPVQSPPAAQQSRTPEMTTGGEDEAVEPMEELTGAEQNPREAAPTWDSQSQRAAEARALTFMRAFARPHLTDELWHEGVAGLMTPQGAEMFAYVDPANVAPTSAEEATALPNESASLAEVHVATDAGAYLVTMIRTSAAGPWLVEYAEPQE